ncbi:hypothetical protein [Virgibacillus halodenitrificans]|uniref:hypothetical protein n=1 Tax=Virgibacillus halodenitrificans TaxID=1482 RepID=UPI000A532E0F
MTQIFLGIAPILWGWNVGTSMLFFAGSSLLYLILFRVFKLWNPKTFKLFGENQENIDKDNSTILNIR